jgi:transcriptional regulator with XRE-family HTH domain
LKNIHTDDQDALCQILRQVRAQADLTQAELASKLGVPQSFVSKYESGERRLDILELREVCAALNLSLPAFVRRLERGIG